MLRGRDAVWGCFEGCYRARGPAAAARSCSAASRGSASRPCSRPRSEAAGFLKLRATGYEAESQLPYAGLHLLLHPVLDHLDLLPLPQREALSTAFGLTSLDTPNPPTNSSSAWLS